MASRQRDTHNFSKTWLLGVDDFIDSKRMDKLFDKHLGYFDKAFHLKVKNSMHRVLSERLKCRHLTDIMTYSKDDMAEALKNDSEALKIQKQTGFDIFKFIPDIVENAVKSCLLKRLFFRVADRFEYDYTIKLGGIEKFYRDFDTHQIVDQIMKDVYENKLDAVFDKETSDEINRELEAVLGVGYKLSKIFDEVSPVVAKLDKQKLFESVWPYLSDLNFRGEFGRLNKHSLSGKPQGTIVNFIKRHNVKTPIDFIAIQRSSFARLTSRARVAIMNDLQIIDDRVAALTNELTTKYTREIGIGLDENGRQVLQDGHWHLMKEFFQAHDFIKEDEVDWDKAYASVQKFSGYAPSWAEFKKLGY